MGTARTISREELERAVKENSVLVLEALPPEYFAAGHLPGAKNLPLDDIDGVAAGLIPSTDHAVVTYCSNTACNNSTVAADRLSALGYTNVRKFAGGKEEWEAAGLPLETGQSGSPSPRSRTFRVTGH